MDHACILRGFEYALKLDGLPVLDLVRGRARVRVRVRVRVRLRVRARVRVRVGA